VLSSDRGHKISDNLSRHCAGFLKIRKETESICAPLSIEDYVVQPLTEVSPPKWHLAHTTWFFEEMFLVRFAPGFQRFHPKFNYLFNSYYKSVGPHCPQGNRGSLSRPSVGEIYDYRQYIDEHMLRFLQENTIGHEQKHILETGLEHEQQHQELLLMDIKAILGLNPLRPTYSQDWIEDETNRVSKTQEWESFSGGMKEIGFDGEGFSYDNERPRHRIYAHPFQIASDYISNGQYLEFIQDGGYQQASLWPSMGWDWVQARSHHRPLYWYQEEEEFFEYTLAGTGPLDRDRPVSHINYFEASAFAHWAGARLPYEYELELFDEQTSYPKAQFWCWTQSQYSPYPGFKRFSGRLGEYNAKFMCNQFVLRGGCVATPKGHYRSTYRNFYLPEQQWMFSGIRLAKDNPIH
jgi:ergothioneine biosynthesis protein EgtB